jgi:hypothetical protein
MATRRRVSRCPSSSRSITGLDVGSKIGSGAGEGNRTPDLLITSEPLCRLSYPGEKYGL